MSEIERKLRERLQQLQREPTVQKDAPMSTGAHLVPELGFVQILGRRPLEIQDTAINVPFPQLLMLVAQTLQIAYSDHPSAPAMRAAIAGLPLPVAPPPVASNGDHLE